MDVKIPLLVSVTMATGTRRVSATTASASLLNSMVRDLKLAAHCPGPSTNYFFFVFTVAKSDCLAFSNIKLNTQLFLSFLF